jgi:hypothetical protein
MPSLLDHIRSINREPKPVMVSEYEPPDPQTEGPFIYVEPDGTEVEYDYDDRVIAKGGDERMDDEGKVYFVPLSLLPEFDYMDETTQDNDEFWAWMDEFVKEHNLTSTRQKKQRAQVKASDWGFGQQQTYKHLSDQWGASKYFQDYSGDEAKRLAIALQAVRSTVRVVDTHARKLTVELADRDMQDRRDAGEDFSPTSLTDFANRRLFVSACAMLDKKLEEADAIDITTGFALHEASHGEYTEDVFPALDQPTRLMPLEVSGTLLNVMEDTRIEAMTADKWPGFGPYFDRMNEYMWDEFLADKAPREYGPGLTEKMNVVVGAVKWPEQYESIARQDPILSDEFDYWNDWRDRYLAGGKPRGLLVEAIAHLGEDPETKQEIEDKAKEEQQDGLDQMALEEALAEALRKNPNLMKPCTSVTHGHGHEQGLDVNVKQGLAERAKKMADEELAEDKVINQQFPHGEGAPGSIVVLKPAEDDRSNAQYKAPNSGLVAKMKHSFLMRPSAMEWTDRLQKGGTVDEDEIWRAGAGDFRFFERRTVESAPDTSVALLVDMSGSMGSSKLRSATDAATILHACTKDMPGVRVRMYGHTGDQIDSGEGNSVVYRIWENGDPMTRLGTIMTQRKGDNYDGYALGWVVQDLLRNSKPEEQMVVFIISDGLPNGWGHGGAWGGYGGEGAMDHIRDVVSWAERQGVDIIQIAVDNSLRAEEQQRMYKHWIPFESVDALPGQIMNAMKKLI